MKLRSRTEVRMSSTQFERSETNEAVQKIVTKVRPRSMMKYCYDKL